MVLGAALAAHAAEPRHGRAHVATFATRGDGLSYFGPEVARAVAAGLTSAGVVCTPNEVSDADVISGRIEELKDERVRLSATVRGKVLVAEGSLESIDAVATQLAQKIAPLLVVKDPIHGAAPAQPLHVAAAASSAKPAPVVSKPPESSPPKETAPAAAAAAEAPKPAEAKPAPAVDVKPAEAPRPTAQKPARDDGDDERTPPPAPTPSPTYAGPPTAQPAAAPAPQPYYPYSRSRVVVHAIPDLPNTFSGTGASATQAFYYFMRARLRLQVVPTGYGVAPPQMAADEAWRSGARSAVMVRLTDVQYLPAPGGMTVRCQLEVNVVRDGRLVMRRYIASQPTDTGPPGLRRGREMDPIFQAVLQSLDTLQPELAAVL
jgi:hypothetical protein